LANEGQKTEGAEGRPEMPSGGLLRPGTKHPNHSPASNCKEVGRKKTRMAGDGSARLRISYPTRCCIKSKLKTLSVSTRRPHRATSPPEQADAPLLRLQSFLTTIIKLHCSQVMPRRPRMDCVDA
jgi:hypothetical protein